MFKPDTCVTLVPYFEIHDGKAAEFKALGPKFVDRTRTEAGLTARLARDAQGFIALSGLREVRQDPSQRGRTSHRHSSSMRHLARNLARNLAPGRIRHRIHQPSARQSPRTKRKIS